ncbi:DUF883 family protein [Rhizobium sp. SL42]|uniref:DUF883 family protein n=1 Tax=Rhizobium sp. SL42 TaxID=2806346 RepID=UPI001F2D2698|nr:hypothetical protein [Rhizobium sp. SL42]UJW74794.1 DUF883 family protein [Rhizobium sp. SL42]
MALSTTSKRKIEDTANDIADRIEALASTDASATPADIQAELDNLRRDLASLTKTVASFGSGKIREAGSVASQLGADAAETSTQYVEAARDTLVGVEQDLKAQVQAHPFQSLAIAAGIGYFFALLSRR